MSRYWSPIVSSLDPYVPGEQPKIAGLIKLNTNEHPMGPSPRVIEAIHAAADETLRLYPDPQSDRLRNAIAEAHNVSRDSVFVGNGSDEVLAHVFLALFKHEDGPLLFPDITYSFYPVYCALYQIAYETVPVDEALRIDAHLYSNRSRPARGIILPNPNAPTGIALPRDEIASIALANPQAVVVVDEAYVDFGAESCVELTHRHENILTVHTLSKSRSLAGLRVGYAIGPRPLIEALERVKNSFNSYPIDRLAEAGAVASLEDRAYFEKGCAYVAARRAEMIAALESFGFEVLPSQANFVFARLPGLPGAELAAFLRSQRVLVRHFNRPRISDYLRISIGTESENEALVQALRVLPR